MFVISTSWVDEQLVIGYQFSMKIRLSILLLVGLGLAMTSPAMDRWTALSMIESGDDDHAVGPGGEISRFQIRHKLWPGCDAKNPQVALAVAREIMRSRLAGFQINHRREVTNFEFYVLWNAPWQADHPSAVVTERARRFANLVELR